MADPRTRLNRCFSAVFANLDEAQIPQATRDTVDGWDSLATFTLLTVIEEEFQIQVSPEDVDRFTSHEAILDCLHGRYNAMC
ncbi:acyl carrier protein [Singulisphaera sp. GP187]|uniref:acyl carrier protein n=1 Tax=Singulisphaera sp. GP187 TaxID=1882752 RepID=UPI00092C3CB5|nr:acyl carrier protein [Singulisphaera sp. GP187]SIO61465.1 acyl carrier protein [Singulisphaera sp. GP187]